MNRSGSKEKGSKCYGEKRQLKLIAEVKGGGGGGTDINDV